MNNDTPTQDDSIHGKFDALAKRVQAIEKSVHDNNEATLEGNRDVREILEMFQTVKGGMKVLGWLGAAIKWLGVVAGALLALYGLYNAAIHPGQQLPKP